MPYAKRMTAYDEVHYPTHPKRLSCPVHLAGVARLFGIQATAPANCRVLELGCGDGGNLVAMALTLPGSRFVGVDLAATAVAQGNHNIAALGLGNVRLETRDISDMDSAAYGEFDYIVAHGLYSWVPASVRDRILALCGELLAPSGVAFVSYNCLPGCHLRNVFRDLKRYHVRHFHTPAQQIAQARAIMRFAADHALGDTYRALLNQEAEKIGPRADGAIYHDDLAEINDPVLFTGFLAHAAAHGLQYLAEAELHLMFVDLGLPDYMEDPIEREQYADFLRGRSFRQTVLCRAGLPVTRSGFAERLAGLWFSADLRVSGDGGEIRFERPDGPTVATAHPVVMTQLNAIASAYPARLSAEQLAAGDALWNCIAAGLVDVHAAPAPYVAKVTARPCASALARFQAGIGTSVYTLALTVVDFTDDLTRKLITLLDGTRDRAALLKELGPPASEPGLEATLRHLARAALLCA
jgi:SAM-dependent methyltransferase